MAVEFGKTFLPFLGVTDAGVTRGATVKGAQRPKAFKTAGYASIPYEKHPKVTDTVPTKDASGKPLLAGYVTPDYAWIA